MRQERVMIPIQQAPYPYILDRCQADSHQYTDPKQIIARCTDRLWIFQNYHVAETDTEGYEPHVIIDGTWRELNLWLHELEGVEWLLGAKSEWPLPFQKWLLLQLLRQ